MPDNPPLSPIESIRKRPGMYLGASETHLLVGELFANVVDLFLAGKASRISIEMEESGLVTVVDDGPGLPYDKVDPQTGHSLAETHLLVGHQTPTADGHHPHVHYMTQGIGLIVVTALSEELEVQSWRNGAEYTQAFRCGEALGPPTVKTGRKGHGTRIRFLPDHELFEGKFEQSLRVLRSRLFDAAHLFPGLRIGLQEEWFHSRNGMVDYVETLHVSPVWWEGPNTVQVRASTQDYTIDFACGGRRVDSDPTLIRTWVNGIYMDRGGTHVTGIKRALARTELRPMVCMMSILLKSPRFNSPTKSELVNPEVQDWVEETLTEGFREHKLLK